MVHTSSSSWASHLQNSYQPTNQPTNSRQLLPEPFLDMLRSMQREQILRFERARALLAGKHGCRGGTHVARVAGRDQVLVESVRVCKSPIAGGAGELWGADDRAGSLVVACCWSADDGSRCGIIMACWSADEWSRWRIRAGRGVSAGFRGWCGTRGIGGVHDHEVLI